MGVIPDGDGCQPAGSGSPHIRGGDSEWSAEMVDDAA